MVRTANPALSAEVFMGARGMAVGQAMSIQGTVNKTAVLLAIPLVTSAWIGHDLNDRPLGPHEQGAKAALPIWMEFMKNTLAGTPIEQFPKSVEGISWYAINAKTGVKADESTAAAISAPFKSGTKPPDGDAFSGTSGTDPLMIRDY